MSIKLHKKQQKALDLMIQTAKQKSSEALLTGGAGTGKTSCVVALLRELDALRIDYIICAPTHKACQVLRRMASASGIEAPVRTIHSYLALKPRRGQDGVKRLVQGSRPRDLFEEVPDLIVYDEVSMNSAQIQHFVDKEIKETGVSVIYIGDPAQLPPTDDEHDESPVFAKIPEKQHQHLTKVFRQGKGNPIIEIATEVRLCLEEDGYFPALNKTKIIRNKKDKNTGYHYFSSRREVWPYVCQALDKKRDIVYLGYTNALVDDVAKAMRKHIKGKSELFEPGERYVSNTQVMPATLFVEPEDKRIKLQSEFINNEELVIKEREPMKMPPRTDYYKDSQLEILNQTLPLSDIDGYWITCHDDRQAWQPKNIGQIKAIRDRIFKTPIEQRRPLMPELNRLESYMDLRLPYSSTIHKSQGSSFDIVVLDLEDMNKCAHRRNDYLKLLYTGMTRAETMLWMVGESEY